MVATSSAEGGAVALALLGSRWVRAADVLACAARLLPRAEVRGGQWRLLAVLAGSAVALASAEGEGSGTCFAFLASGPGH